MSFLICDSLDSVLLPASEEFDKLCFEFGIELDEDVSAVYFSRFTPSTRRYTWT
jgi:hypothetical protein